MAWARNPEVVSTELEDGAVLLNMETRLYYSLDDVGLEVWRLLDGAGPEELARALAARFDVSDEDAAAAASRFLGELERERLIVPAEASGELPEPDPGGRRAFSEPQLVKHDEPLHEVAISPLDPQLPLAE